VLLFVSFCLTDFFFIAHPSTHYCSARGPTNPVPSAKNLSTNFEEVFLLEQPRQGSGWQAIVETLARIAPFVEEIKNSKMSILVKTRTSFVASLLRLC